MERNPWQWAVIAVIALGVLSTALLVNGRIATENQAKEVEFALDYTEIQKLADQSRQDVAWWLKTFREMGAKSAAVGEDSFYSLREEGRGLDYGLIYDIRQHLDWQDSYPAELTEKVVDRDYKDHYLLVRIQEQSLRDMVKKAMASRYPGLYDVYTAPDMDYYVIKNRPEDVLYTPKTKLVDKDSKPEREVQTPAMSMTELIGLGFDAEKVARIQAAGLDVIPRTTNYQANAEHLVEAYKNDLKTLGVDPRVVLFIGKEVTGYPDHQDELMQFMKERGIAVGLIETPVQRSQIEQADITRLTRDLDYDAVRVFSLAPFLQKRFQFYNYQGAEEIENTFYRAITERNIRLIYFKPYKFDDIRYVTDPEEYRKTFVSLAKRLEPHGIRIGSFSLMPAHQPAMLNLVLLASSLWAAVLLIVSRYLPLKGLVRWELLGLGIVGAAAAFRIAPALAGELTALGAALLFPTLGGWYYLLNLKRHYLQEEASFVKTLTDGIMTLVVTTALSLVAGLMIAGTLSGSEYLLEMSFFRGVKATQLLPLAILTLLYLLEFGYRRNRKEIQDQRYFPKDLMTILTEDIKIYYVLLAGIVGAIGYVYIARTGHESGIQPSDLEMIARNFLENELLARPRTKEFLLAFPAIVAAFAVARFQLKKLIFPALLCGMIGLTSIANTFSHLRTPVYLSVFRTGYSVAFGLLIGAVAFAAVWGLFNLLSKRIRSIAE